MTELICKDVPNYEYKMGLHTDIPTLEIGKKYHLLSVVFSYDKVYYSLIEFGGNCAFEANLFDVVDNTPHWKQWQETLNMN